MNNKSNIQASIIDTLPSPCHGLLNLAPRVGKSKIAIDIIKRDKPKSILWVTPNAKLRDIDIPGEFKTWKALGYLKKTKIICYASLSEIKGKYDLIILDEYQDITENNSKVFFDESIIYKNIIGLSGTHPKHKEKLEIYKKLNLKILTSMSIDEAVENKLIAPYDITVIELRLDAREKNIEAGNKIKKFMQTEEAKYIYLTRLINSKQYSGQVVPKFFYLNRMRFIYNLKSKHEFAKKFINKLPGRTMVFTGSIAQAEDITKYTYHSETDDKYYNAFIEEKIDLLACVNSGGIGSTYRNVDNFVIIQVNSNGKGDATQKIARSLVLQENYKANIYILCVVGTVDENWKNEVLKSFNSANIKHVSYKNYE